MGLILLRHTQPDIAPGICYGRTNLDLASSFVVEARDVVNRLDRFHRIVSSPLTRCRKLAEFIANQTHCTLEIDDRLIEMDFGAWEGIPWSDIPSQELDAWNDDFMHATPHGGESVAILRTRTHQSLDHWKNQEGTSLLVTHMGVIKAAVATGDSVDDYHTEVKFGGFVTL